MKKLLTILFVLTIALTIPNQSNAQAFEGKGSKTLLVGLGFSNYPTFFTENNVGVKGTYSPFSFNVGVQGEFGIHDYVGLGFTAGATFAGSLGSAPGIGTAFGASNWSNIGIPIGMIGNFHFLQLIADKTGGSFAESMDVYAGLAFGAGPSFAIPNNSNVEGDVGVLFLGEAHVGIRYYFSDKLGVFAEVGQGQSSRVQGGLALKF